jgi:uncharacterized protein (TIGR03067 family)
MLGLALTVAAPAPKAEAKKDPASPVGTWVGVKALAGGKELPVPPEGIEFTMTADGVLHVNEGGRKKADTGTYKIDPKKDPAEIDLIPPPTEKEGTILGIYKVEGDMLTLCFGRGKGGAGERPKKFESPEGAEVMLMTLKRKVDKDKPKE